MSIHPTAIIDPSAVLHPSVSVGPFSIIEAGVTIDEDTIIEDSVRIHARTVIGKRNHVHRLCSIGGTPQDIAFDVKTPTFLKMGDDNSFHENCIFHRATKLDHPTTIGNHNFLMGNSHAAHDVVIGDYCILANGSLVAGHAHLGNRVFISGNVAVHQFVNIGDYAMIGGIAKITKDVPPYTTADGNPAVIIGLNVVGLRRNGFTSEQRESIRQAYKIIYHSNYVTSKALSVLKESSNISGEVQSIINFIESSKRGITDHQ